MLIVAPRLVSAETVSILNPLGETDVRVIIGRIISAALSIIGSIALLMFVYGGVLWLTSFGETAKVDKGKKILVWATLGLGMIVASYAVVNAIILGLSTGSVSGAT